tara:strand:+ start:1847 stop:3025 length:1179 start_codon:yes stop_codon:yes gene_type:complete
MAIGRKDWFMIDPESVYLTHGTFGACLKVAFDSKMKWQHKIESDPFDFLNNHAINDLEYSRKILGSYLNCDHDDVVYFPNPSTALNAVIKSLKLKNGDEVLTSNHEYGSLDRTWKYYSQYKNYNYKQINIDIPYNDKNLFLDSFLNAINSKTKVIYLSHITSSTGLVFPIKEICEIARNNNIMSIIDGAHAPGQVEVDMLDINPDIYVGACHKWMCSPKGASFLYANKRIQDLIDPLVISWGWESDAPGKSQFLDYHQYQGTNDVSAYLTIPEIVNFFKEHKWNKIQKQCHSLILDFLKNNQEQLETCSTNPEHLAQMLSFKVNKNSQLLKSIFKSPNGIIEAQNKIFDYNQIRIPIIIWNQEIFTRLSIQAYNKPEDIEKLLDMLNHFNLL